MTEPPGPPGPPGPPAGVRAHWQEPTHSHGAVASVWLVVALSLAPAAVALLIRVLAPAFYEPLWDERLTIVGVTPGTAFLLALAAVPALNLLVLRVVRHPVIVAFTTAVMTTIGLFVVILAPAIVLIMINLGASSD